MGTKIMGDDRWAEPREPLRRPLLWWDLAVAATIASLVAIAFVMSYAEASPSWAPGASPGLLRAILLAPLLLYVLLYVVLGRGVLRRVMRDLPAGPAGALFLSLQLVVIGCAVATEPLFAVLQALGYPTIWTIAQRYREAVLWSAALAGTVGATMFLGIAWFDVGAGLISALFTALVSLAFAVFMGTWITRVWNRGERHRELAERLRESQAEVAALSRETGAAAERERLSRELHDTLTQTLTGLVMLSEQADRAVAAGDAPAARDRIARLREASRTAVEEARALVATTQPLADGGLVQTLERVAFRFTADTGMRVQCELARPELDRERQVVMLRAAQEGLANARKHSRATRVRIALTEPPEGGALLLVEDDGVGPDPAPDAGFGLSGLADRVRAVGGSVGFGPGSAGGARLEIRLPRDGGAR